MKRKRKPANPTAAELPKNPEFQEFVGNLRQIMTVPKTEIDRLLEEERRLKAKVAEEFEDIEERLAGTPDCEPC